MTDYLALWRKHKREGVPQKIPIEYLWKDFEVNLSQLNRERVFDFVDSRLPKLYEDFRYADYYAPIDYISDVVQYCSTEMQYQFHRWVNTLHYFKGFKKKMVHLNQSAAFLNFASVTSQVKITSFLLIKKMRFLTFA